MREGKQQIYWDACIFIHYIEGTERWMPTLDAILEEVSERKTIEIYTSTVSITEVAFAQAERVGRALDPTTEAAIGALWADREVIRLVEFNEVIARGARDLLRQAVSGNRRLKPMDAIQPRDRAAPPGG